MLKRNNWSEEEYIIALSLYFQLPYGKDYRNVPEVIELAKLTGRTVGSICLRMANFASCDPYILSKGQKGMDHGGKTCQTMWDKYADNKENLFITAEQIKANLMNTVVEKLLPEDQQKEIISFAGEERVAYVKTRVNQNAFRNMILSIYDRKCAISGIDVSEMLIASHIIPWADNSEHRLDPSNGICLSALYDKAFDKGYIAIDPNDYTVILSKELKEYSKREYFEKFFGSVEHNHIILPQKHNPNPEFLQYHIDNIFKPHN